MAIFDKINDLRNKGKNTMDDVSTKVYRTFRELSEKVNSLTSGKKKTDESAKKEAEYQKQMRNQMLGGSSDTFFKEYQIEEDGISLDANRAEFNVIDKEEYQAPVKILTPKEMIENFLYNDGDNAILDTVDEDAKEKRAKEFVPEKLEKGQSLKTVFLEDKFDFKTKNELLKDEKVRIQDSSVERYGQLNYIVNAFAGDKEALAKVDEIQNDTVSKRFCNIISKYFSNEYDIAQTSDKLYLEIHGIDNTKIADNTTQDKIVALCALSELGQDATKFADISVNEIRSINSLVKNNANINIEEYILKNSIDKLFDKTRKEGDQVKSLEMDLDGGAVDSLVFENEGDGAVSVYHESLADSNLVARQDSLGKYEKPEMEANLINAFKHDKGARDEIEGRGRDGLDHQIEMKRSLTRREALENPMSEQERREYDKEQQEALTQHQKLVNQYANNN